MSGYGDSREMGCSRADIARWLREITGLDAIPEREGAFVVALQGFDLRVQVEPVPSRRLGLVVFRANRVSFLYPPQHQQAARDWIRHFDFHTQRGGG